MPPVRGLAAIDKGASKRNPRTRKPISCLPCRRRKLRCDRTIPVCGTCINRGEVTACSYALRTEQTMPSASDLSESAQDRIDHLEQLVVSLLERRQYENVGIGLSSPLSMETDEQCDGTLIDINMPQDHGSRQSRNNCQGSLLSTGNSSIQINSEYKQCQSVDDGHWSLLLNEIGEVRSHLMATQKYYEEQAEKMVRMLQQPAQSCGPALLFGSANSVSRAKILAQLPSKYSCDNLIKRFFDHLYPPMHILHERTFKKQYARFWLNRDQAPVAWIALLFAILRIAALDYLREDDEPVEFKGKCQDLASSFRDRLTDSLILADYLQPQDFLIEALCFHLYGEFVSSRDAKSSVWVLIGMIARLAMRMGYHQALQPDLTGTPFQAEMRRRVWAFIRQADVMFSFQMGLPSMVDSPQHEATLPRNIYDDSFDEDCSVLPDALPDSEPTQVAFLIAKTKLAFGFARALKEISGADSIRWERVLEIDCEIRRLYDNIPYHYKLGPLSSRDSLVLTSARFVLASIHHKSLCAVHSRFLETARVDKRYSYSRRVCLSSAISILRFQAIQNEDIPVDGGHRSLTNYQTSIAIHDYLLAATIISADLCSRHALNNSTQPMSGTPSKAEMVKALEDSARIFRQMQHKSMDAYKAADVLEMLLKKFGAKDSNTVSSIGDQQRGEMGNSWQGDDSQQPRQPNSYSRPHPTFDPLEAVSTTNPTNETDTINVAFPKETYQIPGVFSYSDAGNTILERLGSIESANLESFSLLPSNETKKSSTPSSSFSQLFPEVEISASWSMVDTESDPATLWQ